MSETKSNPPLAGLVLSGEGQTEAEAITDFVFMATDVSNAYLVTTADGDVMVNTGFMTPGAHERNKKLLGPRRTGPLRAIILTQSHPDHFGGVDAFKEAGTEIIVQEDFLSNFRDMTQPFFGPRTRKLWGTTMQLGETPPKPPVVVPTILVDREHAFEIGGRRFELINTPDGETTDSLTVWMPKEKIVFTGNLFGPIFLSMPFLNTLRGDKPRLVRRYLKSLDRVRNLGAEILITGHGQPVYGAEKVRADLDRLHAAVAWVRDYTISGMNAGKDVHRLMREVRLPEEIAIGEFHGKVSWAVRSIWEEYSGWFHYDSTTSLYGVPRSSVDGDLAELAGGAGRLAERAKVKLAAGEPLQALHLTDIALGAEPRNRPALEVKKGALGLLLEQSGGTNLSETMWLRSEIRETEEALGTP